MQIQNFILPLIILASGFVIANILNFVLEILRKKAEATETKLDDIILHALGKPLYILIIVIGVYYAIHRTPYLGDLINSFDEGYRYRHFILTIFGTWIVASLAKNIIREYGMKWPQGLKDNWTTGLSPLQTCRQCI